MPSLQITRDVGWADRFRSYSIVLDGQQIGSLAEGQKVALEIAPGRHRLRARIDWCGSPEIEFDASGSESIHFRCESGIRGSKMFLAVFYILFFRNEYLHLQRLA